MQRSKQIAQKAMRIWTLTVFALFCAMRTGSAFTPIPPTTNYIAAIELPTGLVKWCRPLPRSECLCLIIHPLTLEAIGFDHLLVRTNRIVLDRNSGNEVPSITDDRVIGYSKCFSCSNLAVTPPNRSFSIDANAFDKRSQITIKRNKDDIGSKLAVDGYVQQVSPGSNLLVVSFADQRKRPHGILEGFTIPPTNPSESRIWRFDTGRIRQRNTFFTPEIFFELLDNHIIAEAGGMLYKLDPRTGTIEKSFDYWKVLNASVAKTLSNAAAIFLEGDDRLLVIKSDIVVCIDTRSWNVNWILRPQLMYNKDPAAAINGDVLYLETGPLVGK